MSRTARPAFLASLFVSFVTILELPSADAESLPAEIRAALEKNGDSLSPLSIYWTETTVLPGPGDAAAPVSVVLKGEFTWQDSLFRYEDVLDRSALRSEHLSATRVTKLGFNGRVLFFDSGTGLRNSPVEKFIEGDPKARLLNVGYLDAAGVYLPSKNDELPDARLQSKILFQLDHGGSLESVKPVSSDGEPEPVLQVSIVGINPKWQMLQERDALAPLRREVASGGRSEKDLRRAIARIETRRKQTPEKVRFVYDLAPRFGYAVLRYNQFTLDDHKQKECVNSSFELLPNKDVWLPKKVLVAEYEEETEGYQLAYREKPWQTHAYVVSEIDTRPFPESHFVLRGEDIEPGRRVIDDMNPDLRLPDGTTAVYIMPGTPDDLDEAIARAAAQARGESWSPNPRSYMKRVLIGLALLFIAIASFRILWKMGRAPRTGKEP